MSQNLSQNLLTYLDIESVMFELDSRGDLESERLADKLRDVLEPIWHALTSEERAALNARGTIVEPSDICSGVSS